MSAGDYRAEDGEQLYVKVDRANEGTLSTRPETGALAMALTETRGRRKALIYIGDSSTLLTAHELVLSAIAEIAQAAALVSRVDESPM